MSILDTELDMRSERQHTIIRLTGVWYAQESEA